MDTKDLKNRIKKISKKGIKVLKDALTLPFAKIYLLLSIPITIIIIILTFPYDVLIRDKLPQLAEGFSKGIYIGNVECSIITSPNLNIDNTSIILKDGAELNFRDIETDFSLISIINNTLKGKMTIQNLEYSNKDLSLNGIIKFDFNIKFKSFSDMPSRGVLILESNGVFVNGITIKGFDIPPVRFKSVTVNIKISGSRIDVEDVIFSGRDLKGNIKGFITLSKFIKHSKVDLDLQIDSSSALLEDYKVLLGDKLTPDGKLNTKIKGTLSNPRIDIPGSVGKPGGSIL